MVVEKFGSDDIKEIDLPENYAGCMYCYAASMTCVFYAEGDTHFLRVEGELKEVACVRRGGGSFALKCRSVTEAQARRLILEFAAYN